MFSLPLEFLQTTVNRLLRADPDVAGELRALDGKSVAVCITGETDTGRAIVVHITDAQLSVHSGQCADADAVLTAQWETFPKALRQLFGGDNPHYDEIKISGDVQTGRRFIAAMARLQVDWEEEIARFTGDAPARVVGSTARAFSALLKTNCGLAAEDIGWFLKDDAQLAVRPDEADAFTSDVQKLKSDVEEFSRRLQAVEERAQK